MKGLEQEKDKRVGLDYKPKLKPTRSGLGRECVLTELNQLVKNTEKETEIF